MNYSAIRTLSLQKTQPLARANERNFLCQLLGNVETGTRGHVAGQGTCHFRVRSVDNVAGPEDLTFCLGIVL